MSRLIALKSGLHEILYDAWNSNFSNLKQQALLFDQIGIYKLDSFYKTLEESRDLFKILGPDIPIKAQSIITELQWLQQAGLVFEVRSEDELQSEIMRDFPQKSTAHNFESAKRLLSNVIEIQISDLKRAENETRRVELIKEQHFKTIRLLSIIMEITREATVVTTFPHTEYTREIPNSNKNDVAQIVIKNLPLPNNETPWEQLIDYRNDVKTQKLLLLLRRWINRISTQNLSSLEIEDEIEFLINEFQEHMKFHKMRANTETIEVIVNSASDVLGNLLTLKFSKIFEPVFAIKKRQLLLMEAELSAPGKEMAYVIKSREAFGSQE